MRSRTAWKWIPLLALALLGSSPPGEGSNRLADEPSPYLQLHAHNPVDWYPWGDEAFERARAEDKPVFLSVGYSTCYWCHVMEREVFSDPVIAAQLNAQFVSIKVDREERPDIDHIYMQATQLMTSAGGWPNSVFLDHDGKPFYAGTYFPPVDRHGKPGFPRVLDALHYRWTSKRENVLKVSDRVWRLIRSLSNTRGGTPPPLETALEKSLEALGGDFDPEHGGFGGPQKFPRAPGLDLLLARLERGPDPRTREMLVASLDAMALGGIYDHLGGGFHRYSTEPTWSLPHFEKMLYDSALLTSLYARAFALTERPLYRRVVEQTLGYMEREMSLPGGGYASAQDAEVAGVEGGSYFWSEEQIRSVLGKRRTKAWLKVYELKPMPEGPEHGVLRVRLPLDEGAAEDPAARLAGLDKYRIRLLAARASREQPLRDGKALAGWNAMAIRALVDASVALDEPRHLKRAQRAADFVLSKLVDGSGELRRSYIAGQAREAAVLEDYAFLADALLALHEATGTRRWLDAARGLADTMLARFEDRESGGFFLTGVESTLIVRPKPFEDGSLPSGNGIALRVMRRLAAETGEERYAKAARHTAAAAGRPVRRTPGGLATLLAAMATTPEPPPEGSEAEPESADPRPADALHMPRSQDHVTVSARRQPGGSGLIVEVATDEGWHVNANPASSRFLIPTSVEIPNGGGEATIRYPEGHAFAPAFAPEPIQVYEGRIEISVELAEDATPPERVGVRYQACDDERCLAPHREQVRVKDAPQP